MGAASRTVRRPSLPANGEASDTCYYGDFITVDLLQCSRDGPLCTGLVFTVQLRYAASGTHNMFGLHISG